LADDGTRADQTSSPLSMSNARTVFSSAAPTKTRPPAVTSGPPMFGVPDLHVSGNGVRSRMLPSGTRQRIVPLARSTASRLPHGGSLHGTPSGDISGVRSNA
jgi:hypothetical protein